jgi:hypothetical protein
MQREAAVEVRMQREAAVEVSCGGLWFWFRPAAARNEAGTTWRGARGDPCRGETHAAPRAPPAQLHRHGVVRAARRRKGGTVAAAWSK